MHYVIEQYVVDEYRLVYKDLDLTDTGRENLAQQNMLIHLPIILRAIAKADYKLVTHPTIKDESYD